MSKRTISAPWCVCGNSKWACSLLTSPLTTYHTPYPRHLLCLIHGLANGLGSSLCPVPYTLYPVSFVPCPMSHVLSPGHINSTCCTSLDYTVYIIASIVPFSLFCMLFFFFYYYYCHPLLLLFMSFVLYDYLLSLSIRICMHNCLTRTELAEELASHHA